MPAIIDRFARLAKLVASGLPLKVLYDEFHRVIAEALPARNMYVAIADDGDKLRFPWFVDELEPKEPLDLYEYGGLTGALMDRGRRLWMGEDPEAFAALPRYGTLPADWLGVPFSARGGSVRGCIVVQSYRSDERYTEADAAFLEFAADQLGLALALRAAEIDVAVLRIGALVDHHTEPGAFYEEIHKIVGALIPAATRSFIITRIDRRKNELRMVYCVDPMESLAEHGWPVDTGFSGRLLSGGRDYHIYRDDPALHPEGLLGVRPAYWLGAVTRHGGRPTGIVMMQTYDSREEISLDDAMVLSRICPFIAETMERMELYSRLS